MSVKIITTHDGSHSLLNEQLHETYHSIHGAIQESRHVFIQQGLQFVTAPSLPAIHILEIGFGTGLNALLTLQFQHEQLKIRIHYTTVEAYPVEENIWEKLNYPEAQWQNQFTKLHRAAWNQWIEISTGFNLLKLHVLLEQASLTENQFNLVYFDAFAPNKQPELWEPQVLEKIYKAMKKEGVLVTYCAKGKLKRDLKSLGFIVETLPGPPGKREMIRAIKG